MEMPLDLLIPNSRFAVDGLGLLHLQKIIEIRHVLLVEMVGTFSGKAPNHFDVLAGKCGGFVEIVVNNNGTHTIVSKLPTLRGVENILRPATPSD